MRLLKKIILIIITFIITLTLISNTQNNLYANSNAAIRNPVNVGVLLYRFDDPYISLVKQSLENIQRKNENKINFTFYDGKDNQAIQYETLDTLLKNNIDLLIINPVQTSVDVVENFIDKIKLKNIPLIIFNVEPLNITNTIKSYNKAVILSTDAKQSSILQGKLIVDEWTKNKSYIDKNKDNIMQYIMLEGGLQDVAAIARTKHSISTIEDAGIKTQKLASKVLNWNQDYAKNAIESLFLKYDGNIEVIIANSDAMAIGAIEALQKYGYNKGDQTKNIPVFGIDGIQAAQDLIKKGFMTGTVIQDPTATAEALYAIGMNLVDNKNPLENTNYNFDETGIIVRLPYYEYTEQ